MSKQVTLMTDAIPYQEFAKLIGKSTGAVRRMIDKGKLTDVTDLSDWLVDYVLLSIELLNTGAYEIVNWKELSERGLVFRINHEIMHQLGLAVMYEPETGMSGGAMVATDGAWNYSDEQVERAKQNGWLG
ncbi:TPA: hypothetical protein KBO85_003363 [Escherichia coli]|nr:hypothetical protein [Escherichia coli]